MSIFAPFPLSSINTPEWGFNFFALLILILLVL
jgi:hypothetical protein